MLFAALTCNAEGKMTLDDCMRYAVENSFKAQNSEIDRRNAEQRYKNAIASHFPSVSGSVGGSANFGRGIDPETNSYISTSTFNNSVGVNSSMTVFNGFSMVNQTRAAKMAKLRGVDESEYTKDQVAQNTMSLFAEVVFNRELVKLYSQRVESYEHELFRLKRNIDVGIGSMADYTQVQATLASEEYNLIKSNNDVEISIIRLKDCMNYPLESDLDIEGGMTLTADDFESGNIDAITESALTFLPQVTAGKLMLDENRFKLKSVKASYYPSIGINGGISTNYYTRIGETSASSFGSQYKNNLGEGVGVSLSVPLFAGLSRRTNVHIAKNDYQRAENDYAETVRTVKSEIKQAILDLDATHKQWIQSVKNVEAQKEANDVCRRKYEQGLQSVIELQMSDNELFKARAESNNSYLRYQIKIREVNYYKGIPYIK